jgi:hypothetical protein
MRVHCLNFVSRQRMRQNITLGQGMLIWRKMPRSEAANLIISLLRHALPSLAEPALPPGTVAIDGRRHSTPVHAWPGALFCAIVAFADLKTLDLANYANRQ